MAWQKTIAIGAAGAVLCLTICIAFPAIAERAAAQALSIPDAWAKAAYQTPQVDRFATFSALADRARREAKDDDAASLIWKGICISTLAGEKRGLGSLKLVREARAAFRAAINLDKNALEGAAQMSLGALYYKLPAFPVSFGSKRKARRLLNQALEISPKSMDANFFMADFFATIGELDSARRHIEIGLSAPLRPSRRVADLGRRDELRRLLAKINKPAG